MFYIIYGIFYLLSLLPWRIIYIISDGIYVILYYLVGYRKNVVMDNLQIAFPEKSPHERKKIAKEFYKNFVDTFIEAIKLFSISEKELNKRFACDYSVINNLYETGKNVQIVSGHFFNWEFANLAYSTNVVYPLVVVYMPIANKIFNRLFLKLRSRFGAHLVAATNFRNEFTPYTKKRFCLALVGDQNPGSPDNAYWTVFFNKLTPFVKGPEKGAQINRAAVVISHYYKVKRGYYKSEIVLLTNNAREMRNGEITKRMISFIEASVRKHPSNYLWSHRRWKWEFEEEKHRGLVI